MVREIITNCKFKFNDKALKSEIQIPDLRISCINRSDTFKAYLRN